MARRIINTTIMKQRTLALQQLCSEIVMNTKFHIRAKHQYTHSHSPLKTDFCHTRHISNSTTLNSSDFEKFRDHTPQVCSILEHAAQSQHPDQILEAQELSSMFLDEYTKELNELKQLGTLTKEDESLAKKDLHKIQDLLHKIFTADRGRFSIGVLDHPPLPGETETMEEMLGEESIDKNRGRTKEPS